MSFRDEVLLTVLTKGKINCNITQADACKTLERWATMLLVFTENEDKYEFDHYSLNEAMDAVYTVKYQGLDMYNHESYRNKIGAMLYRKAISVNMSTNGIVSLRDF